ncbi:unnamed protein product [Caenorhabditis bovis]|uniref:Uncharacterized protein n=1 Tax=Caenorhabditis bovis TaxID=2654633 RepID=A0A8S1FAW9_9PELO|nr:unnamed protein product [Caenorhabditis bovis]
MLKFARFLSSTPSTSTELGEIERSALQKLLQKLRNFPASERDKREIRLQREWALAPIIEVSGKIATPEWMKSAKFVRKYPIIHIRWRNMPERDLDILIANDETFYSIDVKGILYAMICANFWKEKLVKIRNSNEVAIRVANGRYKANKEVARFELIRKYVGANAKKSGFRVKLEGFEVNEPMIKRPAGDVDLIWENKFFEKFRNSIDELKNGMI